MKRGERVCEAKVVRAKEKNDGCDGKAVNFGIYITVIYGIIRYRQRSLDGSSQPFVVLVLRITVKYKRAHKRIPQIVKSR